MRYRQALIPRLQPNAPRHVVRTLPQEGLLVGIGDDLVAWTINMHDDQQPVVQPRWTLSQRHSIDWQLLTDLADSSRSDDIRQRRPLGPLIWLRHRETGRTECYDTITGKRLLAAQFDQVTQPHISDGLLIARERGKLVCWDITRGRELWSAGDDECISINADSVLVRQRSTHRLQVLDRQSGEVRRNLGAWHAVLATAVAPDRSYVVGRNVDGIDVLAAINRNGGQLLWELPLPSSTELIGSPLVFSGAFGGGCAIQLRGGGIEGTRRESTSVLAVNAEGQVIASRSFNDSGSLYLASSTIVDGPC